MLSGIRASCRFWLVTFGNHGALLRLSALHPFKFGQNRRDLVLFLRPRNHGARGLSGVAEAQAFESRVRM